MSNFVIFEDQENLHEKGLKTQIDGKKDRQKFAPLTNKDISNENAFEKQVRNNFIAAYFLCLQSHSYSSTRLQKHKSLQDRRPHSLLVHLNRKIFWGQ